MNKGVYPRERGRGRRRRHARKRVAASGRQQELHDARGLRAAEGRTRPFVGRERPELAATVALGRRQRRSLGKRGLHLWQEAPAARSTGASAFSIKRLDVAEVVDPQSRRDDDDADRVFFGATVKVRNAQERGAHRAASSAWTRSIRRAATSAAVSPMARALLKAREGDTVTLNTPGRRGRARHPRGPIPAPRHGCRCRRRRPDERQSPTGWAGRAARAATIAPWTRIWPNSNAS